MEKQDLNNHFIKFGFNESFFQLQIYTLFHHIQNNIISLDEL